MKSEYYQNHIFNFIGYCFKLHMITHIIYNYDSLNLFCLIITVVNGGNLSHEQQNWFHVRPQIRKRTQNQSGSNNSHNMSNSTNLQQSQPHHSSSNTAIGQKFKLLYLLTNDFNFV